MHAGNGEVSAVFRALYALMQQPLTPAQTTFRVRLELLPLTPTMYNSSLTEQWGLPRRRGKRLRESETDSSIPSQKV
jgi:hypothetical protein